MIEIRRILCPIDFSDYSRRARDMRSRSRDVTGPRGDICGRPAGLRINRPDSLRACQTLTDLAEFRVAG
jgi:hypothetical protein